MNAASFPYRTAKTIYYNVFNNVATVALRRTHIKTVSRGLSQPSIKIVSYFGWQNGISEGALLQRDAFKALGYDVEIIDVTRPMTNPFARVECKAADLFVIHCGGNQFLRAAWPLRHALRHGRVVGYFAWELPDPPRDWPRSEALWDEIWTPSSYSARALSQWCDCPIKVVPHVLLRDGGAPRQWRRGKGPLRFLAIADARSSLSRKNPQGAIKAFQLAFPRERDVKLTLKLHKTEVRSSPELDRLFAAIHSDPRIRVINKTITRDQMDQLILESHVLVSLHRAEGFGLPLLEAQTFGLATIATAWSGNRDFCTEETSLLIPYTMVSTNDAGCVYGNVNWAEPDIQSASAAMRQLYDAPSELAGFAAAAWKANRPSCQLERFAKALQQTSICSGPAS